MNIKLKILSFIVFASVVLSGCGSAQTIVNVPGQRATVRDAIYSLEPRQNGAFVMWLRYDDEGVYCIKDKAMYEAALKILNGPNGWIVTTYHTYRGDESNSSICANVESGGTKTTTSHTIYVVDTISVAESSN